MKNSKKIFAILASTVGAATLLSSFAHAIEARQEDSETTAQTVRSTGGYNTNTTPAFALPSGSGQAGSAARSGRSAATAQLLTAGVNVGAGIMYVKVCATGPTQAWACPLAAIAGVAANILVGSAGGSKDAASAMSAYNPGSYNFPTIGDNGTPSGGYPSFPDGGGYGPDGSYPGGNPNGVNGTPGTPGANGTNPDGTAGLPPGNNGLPTSPGAIADGIKTINDGLKEAGATLSPDGKTLTTKDGRKFDISKGADGSTQSLMGMGMSASEAEQASAASKRMAASMASKVAKLNLDGSGGGGGGGAGAGARGPADEGGAGGRYGGFNFDPRNKARAKAKVSGLTKKLGDEPIGVSQDDIFEMVTRRYKARDQENQFLKD